MDENMELVEYVYKDASMACYTLEKMLEKLKDKDNKINNTVENILKGYERYLERAKEILERNDESLKETGMMAKMGASMGIAKEVITDNSDAAMADMLIKGISMGTLEMEKKIKKYDEACEKEYLELAKDFYNFQQDNLEALKKYL